MVGRALDGEIQRDLHSVVGASRDQPAKIVERAELGVDRVMSAFGGPDCIGTPGIIRTGRQRIVATLPIDAPDGVDGGQIKDVETHRGHVR